MSAIDAPFGCTCFYNANSAGSEPILTPNPLCPVHNPMTSLMHDFVKRNTRVPDSEREGEKVELSKEQIFAETKRLRAEIIHEIAMDEETEESLTDDRFEAKFLVRMAIANLKLSALKKENEELREKTEILEVECITHDFSCEHSRVMCSCRDEVKIERLKRAMERGKTILDLKREISEARLSRPDKEVKG